MFAFSSSEQASDRSSFSVHPNGIISVTAGVPLVIVPVLSSATISTLPVSSSEVAVLNRTPLFAPIPLPTIIATGVASPSAHGQLMTSTEMALASAKSNALPTISQTIKVTVAIPITAGTNTPETLSAIFAIGALVADAFSTVFII